MQSSSLKNSLGGTEECSSIMIKLGHKLPTLCKLLISPDDEILRYLQTSDRKEWSNLDPLPIEKVFSPFLVRVVCERIHREYVLSDDGQSMQSSESMCSFYDEVLRDFDSLLSILKVTRDKAISSTTRDDVLPGGIKEKTSVPPTSSSSIVLPTRTKTKTKTIDSELPKLHKRTMQIIEDLCTLVRSFCRTYMICFTTLFLVCALVDMHQTHHLLYIMVL